jgi:undecaprenol kinase/diacylglycerol kinase (ATP)
MLHTVKDGFRYAFTGIKIAWTKGINFRIQILCGLFVLTLGWLFQLSSLEFVIVILVICSVLATETFNTALEELCDKFEPSHDPHIAKIKDLSAAAVLLISIGAGIIGIIIFIPHIW